MRAYITMALIQLQLFWASRAEQKLPADLQVDFIFPRNETYAPTQYFPIVFGIRNLDAVWPLRMLLEIDVGSESWNAKEVDKVLYNKTFDESSDPHGLWHRRNLNIGTQEINRTTGGTPGEYFNYIASVNMTNGTTDQYGIGWDLALEHRCLANNTDPMKDDGGMGFASKRQGVTFSTAPGAPLPDIETIVNSCSVPPNGTAAAIRMTDMRTTIQEGERCPVIDENVPAGQCWYRNLAKAISANGRR